MISGFVILMTLERTRRPLDFVVSRFSRLYPAYWVAVLLTFLVVTFFGLPGREVSVGEAAVNLTMLQGFISLPSVDGVYWILQIELTFYAIMLVMFAIKQLKHVEVLAIVWLAASFVHHLVTDLGIHIPGADTLLLGGYVGFFTAGIMFYRIRNNQATWRSHAIILLSFLIQSQAGERSLTIAAAIFFAVFYVFVYGKLSILAVRPLLFLGAISYPLYLVHQNIGYVILRWLYSVDVSPFFAVPCALVIIFGIATGITYLVERPASTKIRAWYTAVTTRRRERRVAVSSKEGDS